jgi:transcriptional regulator with XRE-family HTH domain
MTTTKPRRSSVSPVHAREFLGRHLRRLRNARRISRAAAAHIGMSESTMSRIELGRIRIEDHDLDQLLVFYGITNPAERRAMLQLSCRLNATQWWHP